MDARMAMLVRGRATRLLVALCAALCLTAAASAAAEAATVRGTPQIRGAGAVTADKYTCTSFNQDDRQTKSDCPEKLVVNDFTPVVSITFTATPSSSPTGHWSFVRWEGCSSVSGTQCTVTSLPFSETAFTPTVVFDDHVGPTITSLSSSASTLEERKFFFFFVSNEFATYQCRVGSASFAPCSSGESRTMPAEGPFTFQVRASDSSGNVSATESIQVIAVDTALTDGPSGLVNSRTATFDFSSAAGIQFECRLDAAAFAPCGNGSTGSRTYNSLADGTHTFRVRARNGEFVDAIPATRTWTIDATPPNTTITAGPEEGSLTESTMAQFGFTSSEPIGATFECRLDGAPFAACPAPKELSGLGAGIHTFEVRAKDAAGNADPTPAKRTWTVEPDVDGDGYTTATDCDDADASVNPGRPEVPGNGVDEDCDGADAVATTGAGTGGGEPQPGGGTPGAGTPGGGPTQDGASAPGPKPVPFKLTLRYHLGKAFTTLRSFRVDGAPKGARVTVSCKGKGCPRKARTFTIKKSRQAVPGYARKRLRPGWVLTVTVRRAGHVTAVRTIKVKRGKPLVASAPRCLPAGAKEPRAC
jgi:hypothetical protein